MFRLDPPPIMRSTTLYLHHLVLVKPLVLPAAIVEEMKELQCRAPDNGWGIQPKHVELFTEIKNGVTLHLVGHTLEYFYDARKPKCQIQSVDP